METENSDSKPLRATISEDIGQHDIELALLLVDLREEPIKIDKGLTPLPCTVVTIFSLGARRGLIKFFVICSGVDVDRCSGKIEGRYIVFAGQE